MNEKQFIHNLKKNDNDEYKNVLQLIEDNNNNHNMKKSVFPHFRKKSPYAILNDNFELVLIKTNPMQMEDMLKLLFKCRETAEVVRNNLDLIINKIMEISKTNVTILFKISSSIVKELKKYFGNKFIDENINKILELIPIQFLAREMNYLKNISDNVDNSVNNYLSKKENLENFINGMLNSDKIPTITDEQKIKSNNTYIQSLSESEKQKLVERHTQTLLEIMKELIPKKDGKELWTDIEYINGGAYSDVYKVGDRVIKIGDVRATYKIPNHTRILQPIARFELFLDDECSIPYGCIEVMEKIRELSNEECDDEKFYELYKELRKAGIVFSDFRASNIGVLLADNSPIHLLNGEKINVVPQSVGFTNEIKGKKRKPGDLVILDTDFLYKESDNNITWQQNGYSKKFERRWQMERQKLLSRTYRDFVLGGEEEEEEIDDIMK